MRPHLLCVVGAVFLLGTVTAQTPAPGGDGAPPSLDQLRQGAQSLAEQMMENGEAQAGKGQGNSGKDPLGRPDRSNRPDLGLSVKVPDQIDIQRAREVLDELRRRLGDPTRPVIELDYLERLIRSY